MVDKDHNIIHPPAFVVDTETLRSVVRDSVSDALIRIGLDSSDAAETRKDLLYLRQWRETMERVRENSLLAAVKWAMLGVLMLVVVGFLTKLGVKLPTQ